MTKFTKTIADRMIRSIMADIPMIDYDQQAQDYISTAIEPLLPDAIRTVLADPKTRPWTKTTTLHSDCGGIRCTIPCDDHYNYKSRQWLRTFAGAEVDDQFAEYCRLKRAQSDALKDMLRQLEANFSGVRSFASFRQSFPDLARYLPPEPTSANLPVTNDLVDRLVALGLPQTALAAEVTA